MGLDLLVLAAPFVGAALFLVWWRRRRAAQGAASGDPPIELILLLSSPRVLPEEHLRAASREAFGREPDETFAKSPGGIVEIDGYALVALPIPTPMVANPAEAAEGISELRMRVAFAEHQAHVVIGCPQRPQGATRADAYARLGRFAAALVDDTTRLVYCSETRTGNLVNEETLEGLRGGDPLATMKSVTFDAIGLISGEDPRMVAATAEARRRLPEFVSAFEASQSRDSFLVKGPFSDGTHTEFMWVETTAIQGETIRGTLANDPFQVRGLRKGATVDVAFADVSDWGYVGQDGPVGLFTERIVRGAMAS